MGVGQTQHVAGVVDGHHLEAEAQTQAGQAVLPGIGGGVDFALDPPFAESARDHDSVQPAEQAVHHQALHALRLDPLDLHRRAVVDAGVVQRLHYRQIGVLERHVLADEPDAHRALGHLHSLGQLLPVGEIGFRDIQAQDVAHHSVEALVVKHQGNLVDALGICGIDHRGNVNVAEAGDLALQLVRDGRLAATNDGVGLNAPAAELGNRVLGGLGFLLAGGADERHQRDVDVADVAPPHVQAHLADGL